MSDAGEIKARVVIEYDGSGIDAAKEDLAKLAELAGGIGGEGGIGDAIAAMGEGFAEGTKGAEGLTEALGENEDALKANEEAISEVNDALDEHQQAVEDATQAQGDFQGQVEETAKQLQAVPSSIDDVTKSTQAMSEQVAKSGDTLATVSQNMADLQDSFQALSPDTLEENMRVFQDLATTPQPFMMLQGYLQETGQDIGGFTESIGKNYSDVLGQMQQSTQGFVDTQTAMDEFNKSDPWAGFASSVDDANKSLSDVNETATKTGGIFGDIFGENGIFGEGGALGELGGAFGDVGGIFGGLMMGLDQIARPLFAMQMLGQMASSFGSYIYNANLAAEGPNASNPSSFTSQVDQLTKGIQDSGNAFAVGFGQGLLPFLNAQNAGAAQGSGGLGDIGKMLGGILGGTVGGLGDIGETVLGAIAGAIGSVGPGGLDNPLAQWGIGTGLTGAEGLRNLWAQMTGQPLPFPGPGTQTFLTTQNPYVAGNVTSGVPGSSDYLQNPLSPYYGMTSQEAQDAWNISHYTGTTGPSDPMNAYEHAIAMRYGGDSGYPVPAPNADVAADWAYFNSMPYSYTGPNEAPITQQDVNNQQFGQQPQWMQDIENWKGGFGQLWNSSAAAQQTSGTPGTEGINFGGIGQTLGGIGSTLWGGLGNDFTQIGKLFTPGYWSNLFGGGGGEQAPTGFTGGCFVAGTRVQLADGTQKSIETLQVGEQVLARDGMKTVTTTVLKRITPPARVVYTLTFSNGGTLTLTDSHPIATPEGWKALSVEHARMENPDLPVSPLRIGDFVYTVDGVRSLVSIEEKPKAQIFNITVGEPHTFYANGVLVHNKVGMASADLGQQAADQFQGIQLPHMDLGGMASSLASSFSGIQLPHLDLGGIGASLGGAFSGIQLPHLDLGSMASSLGGMFGGIQLPHLDLGSMGSSLAGAFSGVQLPHLDLSGIGASLAGAFSGISLPPIPNFGSMIQGALSGMFSGITLPPIPDVGAMIQGALGGMFSGISLPPIPDIGGMIQGALGGIFSGIQLPPIPDIGSMINGAISGIFSSIHMPQIPDFGAMINGAISNIFSSIQMPMIPGFASGIEGFSGGLAMVGENGPELVSLPSGSSVYPLTMGSGVGNSSPISLGGSGGSGGVQTANIIVQLDSQQLISLMGVPLVQTINVSTGKRNW